MQRELCDIHECEKEKKNKAKGETKESHTLETKRGGSKVANSASSVE
jgi:hypothetical protein